MAHTPGPWRLGNNRPGVIEREDPATGLIDKVATANGNVPNSPLDNAVLIAAAPDLLAALQLVNDWAHGLPDDIAPSGPVADSVYQFVSDVWPTVDAALAKADREYVA